MKRFFAILLAVVMLSCMLPAVSMAAQYATVVGGWLRLRSAANFNATTITSYYTGTEVEILGSSGGWYKVRTPDGRTGYMYGQYLKVGSSSSSGSVSGNAFVTSHNGYGVRMRTGPGTGYRVIRTYDVGTPVTVLQSGSYWSKISVNGTVGYMMSQFLTYGSTSGGSSSSDSVVCYATIWSRNGYGVRLRRGPSKDYGTIGTYSVGTTVAVLEKGHTWDKIRVGSRVGWMMNEFLDYHNTNEVTSVTLNNYRPAVGTVLSVQAISPSKATVAYEWRVDGVTKGTASTYTVTAADVGYQIQLKVTGTGSYTGSAKSAKTDKVLSNTQLSGLSLEPTAPVVGNTLIAKVEPANASVLYAWIVGDSQVSNASTYTVTTNDIGKTIKLIVTGTGNYSGSKTLTTSPVAASGKLLGLSVANTAPAVGDELKAVVDPSQATVKYTWFRDGVSISNAVSNTYQLTEADKNAKISVTAEGTGNYQGSALTFTISNPVADKRSAPAITTESLPNGKVGNAYSAGLNATGSGITWKITSGTLPAGLTFSTSGGISGTPTAAGTYEVTFEAKNSAGSATIKLPIVIETTVTDYSLTVINGSVIEGGTTSGTYADNTQVKVQAADRTSENLVFNGWKVASGKGGFIDSSANPAIFQTGDANTVIQADYVAKTVAETVYTVTVDKDGVWVEGGIETFANLKLNETVTLKAADRGETKRFVEWELKSGEGTFENRNSAETIFRVGEGAAVIEIIAVYGNVSDVSMQYTLTINGRDASGQTTTVTKSGLFENERVDVSTVGSPDGYEFVSWTAEGPGNFGANDSASTTYTMGAGNATITANYVEKAKETPVALSVSGGTADAYELYEGASTTIYASGESGKEFTGWTLESGNGNFSSSDSPTTTFTMGAGGASIKANYSAIRYNLTVEGGEGTQSNLLPGDEVVIKAPAPSSTQVFVGWKVKSGEGSFNNSKALETTFTIGEQHTTIAPEYAEKKIVTLTIINGSSSDDITDIDAHTVVNIKAQQFENKEFEKWVLNEGAGNFYSSIKAETTFTMKEESATIEAIYREVTPVSSEPTSISETAPDAEVTP